MLKLLQNNPSCLEKLRAEHDAVLRLEVDKAAQILISSPHLLHSLPYTLAVIKETLRLCPSGSNRARVTPWILPKDYRLPGYVSDGRLWAVGVSSQYSTPPAVLAETQRLSARTLDII